MSAGPALLPVFVAANFSVFMLVTRQIAKETDPIGSQAVSGLIAVAIMVPVIWAGSGHGLNPLDMIKPSAEEWGLLIAIGVLGTGAHLLMCWSLRYAPSATLAPMQYLEIPVATLLGFVFFKDLPNQLASLGIVITMASGLYIIYREQATARRLAGTSAATTSGISRRGRISARPGCSICKDIGPVAALDVPIFSPRPKFNPSMGHCKPVDRPIAPASGKSDTTSPARVGNAILGGASKITSSPANRTQGRSAKASSPCSAAS